MISAAVVTTPGEHEVAVARTFAAPRSLVFDAWTQPALIQRWQYGPDGWSMPVCHVDLRVGGAYRFEWEHAARGERMGAGGVFRQIDAPARLVFTEVFDEAWYTGECVVTVTFEDAAGGTLVTMTMRYESREARDMAVESHAADGVATGYERLAEVLVALMAGEDSKHEEQQGG